MGIEKLSSLQLELLKIYSFNPSTEDLTEIKQMLAKFFADKLSLKIQDAIEENNISDDDLEKWLHE